MKNLASHSYQFPLPPPIPTSLEKVGRIYFFERVPLLFCCLRTSKARREWQALWPAVAARRVGVWRLVLSGRGEPGGESTRQPAQRLQCVAEPASQTVTGQRTRGTAGTWTACVEVVWYQGATVYSHYDRCYLNLQNSSETFPVSALFSLENVRLFTASSFFPTRRSRTPETASAQCDRKPHLPFVGVERRAQRIACTRCFRSLRDSRNYSRLVLTGVNFGCYAGYVFGARYLRVEKKRGEGE